MLICIASFFPDLHTVSILARTFFPLIAATQHILWQFFYAGLSPLKFAIGLDLSIDLVDFLEGFVFDNHDTIGLFGSNGGLVREIPERLLILLPQEGALRYFFLRLFVVVNEPSGRSLWIDKNIMLRLPPDLFGEVGDVGIFFLDSVVEQLDFFG